MMVTMWVYLETWIVKDGALPELARGSHLRDVGLRAGCGNLGSARTAVDGVAELADPGGGQGSGSYRYEPTGMCDDWRSSTGRSITPRAVREGLLSATRARCFAHLRSNV
jgi:hypothetical protein